MNIFLSVVDQEESKVLSVYVIHSLPLMTSVVQIFIADKMVLVGHLIQDDTLAPDHRMFIDPKVNWLCLVLYCTT